MELRAARLALSHEMSGCGIGVKRVEKARHNLQYLKHVFNRQTAILLTQNLVWGKLRAHRARQNL